MNDDQTIAQVAIPLPVEDVYDYTVPDELRLDAAVGKRVFVPFGKKKLMGYLVGFKPSTTIPKLKSILDVLDAEPLFDQAMLTLCRWLAGYYLCSLGEAIQCAVPPGGGWKERRVVRLAEGFAAAGWDDPASLELVSALKTKKHLELAQALKAVKGKNPHAVLARLEKKGLIVIESKVAKKKALELDGDSRGPG